MNNNLILINSTNNNFILDIRYASTNNICNQKLYNDSKAYLHPEAFDKLIIASNYAEILGFKLKIFDAYRPFKIQQYFYDYFSSQPNLQNFFSDPKTGAIPHCRGVAVDLTLCDLSGNELDMGSDFDELSSLAFHASTQISNQQSLNRNTLLGIMSYAGFDFYKKEWWHYQLFNPRNYEVLDFTI
jgi:D-alanyl-D-alanine dipeptidase